jgi:hypothetical protein
LAKTRCGTNKFISRYIARTVDPPKLMMFRNGETMAIPVIGVECYDGFVACIWYLIDGPSDSGEPVLEGPTGKAALQFTVRRTSLSANLPVPEDDPFERRQLP